MERRKKKSQQPASQPASTQSKQSGRTIKATKGSIHRAKTVVSLGASAKGTMPKGKERKEAEEGFGTAQRSFPLVKAVCCAVLCCAVKVPLRRGMKKWTEIQYEYVVGERGRSMPA